MISGVDCCGVEACSFTQIDLSLIGRIWPILDPHSLILTKDSRLIIPLLRVNFYIVITHKILAPFLNPFVQVFMSKPHISLAAYSNVLRYQIGNALVILCSS